MMRIVSFIVLTGLLVSCSSTKKIVTAIAKKDTLQQSVDKINAGKDSAAFIKNTLQQINANYIDFNTFSAKVNIDYKDNADKNYDVNAVVRMYKDSVAWISANAVLGIEALRLLITKDSVKVLDKLNKTYTARSMDYLQEVTSLPLNLKTVQDLLMGNPVYLDSNVIAYSTDANSVSLLSATEWFRNLLTVDMKDKTLQRSKLNDADIIRNRTADLTYNDYETKKNILFSTKRRITISEKKKLDIKLEFKQFTFNEDVSFPFSVPKNYKRN
jgi:outer membrane lipoprotein-sorting protein